MNWQEIMNKVLELNELEQEISIKLSNPVLTEVIARNNKYCNNEKKESITFKNAILEHKINITPFQIAIFDKIKVETSQNKTIYENMPKALEEAEKYVKEFEEKLTILNKGLQLIIDIEALTVVEYDIDKDFNNNEYTKKVQMENELFKKLFFSGKIDSSDIVKAVIIEAKNNHLKSLSGEQIKNLMLQTLTLSYDRNAFNFINEMNFVSLLSRESKIDRILLYNLYLKYKQSLKIIELEQLYKMTLEEIYDKFKVIYETDFFKQKIIKK